MTDKVIPEINKDELETLGRTSLRILTYILVLFTPLLVTSFFMTQTIGADLFNPHPVWNDELVYWHGVLTFREVGFHGGYYTFNELAAKPSFTHFDPHGPAFFAFMGVLSSFASWTPGNAVIFNLIFIAIASIIFLYAVRPNTFDALLIALIIGTCWAIPLYIPIAMQECLHQAIAIGFAGLIIASLRHPESFPPLFKFIVVFIVTIFSLIRPTWAFFLIPLVVCWTLSSSLKTKIIYLISSFVLIGLIFVCCAWWASTYPGNFNSYFLGLLLHNPLLAVGAILSKYHQALYLIGRGTIVEISVRQQALFITAIMLAVLLLRRMKNFKDRQIYIFQITPIEVSLHLLVVGLMSLFLLSLQDIFDWRDYRLFAPAVLCSTLIFAAYQRYLICFILIALNLTTFSSALSVFQDFHQYRYTLDTKEVYSFQANSAPFIRYDKNTSNAWCNTVLTHATNGYQFPALVQGLPAGIAFSIILDTDQLGSQIKSKYVLIDDQHFAKLEKIAHLEKLQNFGRLKLYKNLDTICQ